MDFGAISKRVKSCISFDKSFCEGGVDSGKKIYNRLIGNYICFAVIIHVFGESMCG